jgi:hypothetical protein
MEPALRERKRPKGAFGSLAYQTQALPSRDIKIELRWKTLMSEVRRKRQQHRTGQIEAKPVSRDTLIWAGIALILIVAYAGFWYHNNHRYDVFAQCLASKNAKMYGLYWCPHCAEQKAMFGKAFHYVPYVECAIKGTHDLSPACAAAGVKLFPAWQFGSSPPVSGVFPMQELSDKTGCSLP